MTDTEETREQLIEELEAAQQRIDLLENALRVSGEFIPAEHVERKRRTP